MARSTASMAVAFMVSFLLVSCFLREASAAINCNQVTSTLTPCISYIRGLGQLTPACCSGVSKLNSAAQTTPDRQTACNCLKTIARAIPGLNYQKAAALPGQCGVNVPYAISPSTDCTKVH